jgi:hypothetical protein
MTATTTPKQEQRAAASPVGLYKQARGEGASHARALELVVQAYPFMGDVDSAGRELAKARTEPEAPPKAQPAPEPEPEPEVDKLDAIEADARRRIEELTEAKARLSLDAFEDEAVAQDLQSVESELSSAQNELVRLALARAERGRRVAGQAEQAERERVAKERHAADSLSPKIEAAIRAEGKSAAAFARAIAQRRALEARQTAHLLATGIDRQSSPWRTSRGELNLRLASRAHGCESEFAWAGRVTPEELARVNGKP